MAVEYASTKDPARVCQPWGFLSIAYSDSIIQLGLSRDANSETSGSTAKERQRRSLISLGTQEGGND